MWDTWEVWREQLWSRFVRLESSCDDDGFLGHVSEPVANSCLLSTVHSTTQVSERTAAHLRLPRERLAERLSSLSRVTARRFNGRAEAGMLATGFIRQMVHNGANLTDTDLRDMQTATAQMLATAMQQCMEGPLDAQSQRLEQIKRRLHAQLRDPDLDFDQIASDERSASDFAPARGRGAAGIERRCPQGQHAERRLNLFQKTGEGGRLVNKSDGASGGFVECGENNVAA